MVVINIRYRYDTGRPLTLDLVTVMFGEGVAPAVFGGLLGPGGGEME